MPVNIDLAALEQEIQQLTPEQIRQQLVELRTAQRVNQKKFHNPERAKAYQKKRNARNTAMAAWAKTQPASEPGFSNLYEQILAEAKVKADEKLAAAEADSVDVEFEEDATA